MRIVSMVLALALALLTSCSASHYDVKTDADPEADFAGYHSFALPPRTKPDTPNVLDNSLELKRIAAQVVRHLEARGYARVTLPDPKGAAPDAAIPVAPAPDLLLRLWVATQERTDVSTIPASPFWGPWPGYGPYPYMSPGNYGRWGPMYDDVIVRNYIEGTLVVDLVDAKRDELVWRAYIVGTLLRDRERAFAALDEALGRAFADLPQATAARSPQQ